MNHSSSKYLVRAREDLEDGFLGRAIDIVLLTDDKAEARQTYQKYVRQSISEIEVPKIFDWDISEEKSQKMLKQAHDHAMQKENHPLVGEDGYLIEHYGFPENLSDECMVEVAEILGVSTLQFDEITDPIYVIYFPEDDEYLCFQEEVPVDLDSYNNSTTTKAELAFGSQADFLDKESRPFDGTKELIEAFLNKVNYISASTLEELTDSPDELRSLIEDSLSDYFEFEEAKHGITISQKSRYSPEGWYEKYAQINALLKSPIFIEKAVSPDELLELYKKSLDNVPNYYKNLEEEEENNNEIASVEDKKLASGYIRMQCFENQDWEQLKIALLQPDTEAYLTINNILTHDNSNGSIGREAARVPVDLVRWLIEEQGLDINEPDKWGKYPLYVQIYIKNVPVVEELLKQGANPNIHDLGTSALDCALMTTQAEVVKLLLQYNVDLNYKGSALRDCISRLGSHARLSGTDIWNKFGDLYLDCAEEILAVDSTIDDSVQGELQTIQEELNHIDKIRADPDLLKNAYVPSSDWNTFYRIRDRLYKIFDLS